ncbi:zinc-finger domain-containing protein [Telmatospirillum sp.]|uniref:zinc-finger domain-containing protein n=1 Tax=Telmatospirillum sp. TaxID=2079197 RepID=UPI002842506C|nr:zinc-finger domain-containing protein [Telmatospirillum sp.]MDR3436813.1 zinc-finger domain-containing protein [Telmatospirillum sp.]
MVKDVVTVNSTTIACEGKGPESGHPKVYLTFKPGDQEIVCPYCSKTFVLAEGVDVGHGH